MTTEKKNRFAAAVSLILLIVFIYGIIYHAGKGKLPPGPLLIKDFNPESVFTADISGRTDLHLEKNPESGVWTAGEKLIFPVRQEKMDELTTSIGVLRKGRLVAETDTALPFYGLTEESATRIILRDSGGRVLADILTGLRRDRNTIFIREYQSYRIYAAPAGLSDLLERSELLDSSVFTDIKGPGRLHTLRVETLSDTPGMNYILTKGEDWRLYGSNAETDQEKTEQMLSALLLMNGEKMVPLSAYPFPDIPPLVLTLETVDGKTAKLSAGYLVDREYIPLRRDLEPFLYLVTPQTLAEAVKPSDALVRPEEAEKNQNSGQ